MKKFFRKIFAILAICSVSFTTTSCSGDTIKNILDSDLFATLLQLVQNYFAGNGQYQYYDVNGKVEFLTYDAARGGYATTNLESISNIKFGVAATSTTQSATADLTVDAYTTTIADASGASATTVASTQIVLSGLSVKTLNDTTLQLELDPSKGVNVDGKLTVNGKEYPLSNLYVEGFNVTSNGISFKYVQFYFGTPDEKGNAPYVISFEDAKGTLVQTVQ